MNRGTILRGIGGFYTVLDDEGRSYTLRAQGKIRKERLTPLVGDEVEFAPGEDGWEVKGELLTVDAKVLKSMDGLEGYPRFYRQ